MIPVTQTKVVVKNSQDQIIVRGNSYAAVIASLLELQITDVPNVETLFHIEGLLWNDVMNAFIKSHGYELQSSNAPKVFHDDQYMIDDPDVSRDMLMDYWKDKFYTVSGDSPRGVKHLVIYQNGKMIFDPHPTREGVTTFEEFQHLVKIG